METQKRARIEALKDEVKQLHPLLQTLLPKMPGVKSVEHTHGPNEMGADFIIGREDDVLGSFFYVAIVAKVGRIEQADVPELKRQVNEAFYPKLVQNGKQEVSVSEVWVVTTGHISHNAKIGIRNELASRKIEFITGDKLAQLVDKYFRSYWTDISWELGQYLHALRARNEEIEQSVSLTNMVRDVYIEQDLIYGGDEGYETEPWRQRPKPHVDLHSVIRNQNAILIEGDMGSGKSKLIRRLTAHYTAPEVYLEQLLVPIAVPYKELLDNYSGDFEKLLGAVVGAKAQDEIPPKARYLVLVDGIDEKNLSASQQLETLNTLVSQAAIRKDIKLLMTSRYLGAIDKKELSAAITRLELLPLTPAKLLQFVKRICAQANISARIYEDIKHSPLFRDLPRSPIAAILLSNLLKSSLQDLPSNLPELYSKYLELALGRWDIEKGIQSQKEYEALNSLMIQLATLTVENEMPFLTLAEVRQIFTTYTKERNVGVSADRALTLMKERCCVSVVDERQQRFYFKHRTFAEFFYAQALIRRHRFKIDRRAFHPYWENTFYFAVGALRDCPEELQQLIQLRPEGDLERFLKVVNLGNYFMAAYHTPYKIISEGVRQITIEAAEFYRDIVKQRIKSDFECFPEMHLLHLFQWVMRGGYSYNFFSEAVEQAAIDIADSALLDDEVKAYALFFLNVIFIQMQKKDSFDWLLKNYAKILPLSVELAVSHEADRVKARTALVRRHDRALRHAIKNSKEMGAALEKMYGRPIRSLRASRLK